MATFQLDITNSFKPDASGEVFYEPYLTKDSGAVIDTTVLIFNDSGTKDGATTAFVVPKNYIGTAKLIVFWNANATTGNCIYDLSYLTRSNGEDMGAAATSTSDTVTQGTNGTAFNLNTSTMTLTSSNFTAGDICLLELFRDTLNASDTLAVSAIIHKVVFEYADV